MDNEKIGFEYNRVKQLLNNQYQKYINHIVKTKYDEHRTDFKEILKFSCLACENIFIEIVNDFNISKEVKLEKLKYLLAKFRKDGRILGFDFKYIRIWDDECKFSWYAWIGQTKDYPYPIKKLETVLLEYIEDVKNQDESYFKPNNISFDLDLANTSVDIKNDTKQIAILKELGIIDLIENKLKQAEKSGSGLQIAKVLVSLGFTKSQKITSIQGILNKLNNKAIEVKKNEIESILRQLNLLK